MSDYASALAMGSLVTGATNPRHQGAPPAVIDTPAILAADGVVGTSEVGATLTVTMGNWDGDPYAYTAIWQGDGADIGEGEHYVVQPGDAGTSITAVVTATNSAGATAAPPSNAIAIAAA